MAVHKIVLFYAFTPLPDAQAVRLWQRALADRWSLTGRVIVAPHGVNATLGGTVENLKRYVKATREHPGLRDIDVKWSDGHGDEFPRLSVKVRDELVTFGVPDRVRVDAGGVVGGGARLSPQGLHDLVAARGDDVVMLDGRNAFEAEIGRFAGAVVPDVSTTRDFVDLVDAGGLDHLRDRPVVTYCTGGVRCEVLSALLADRGFAEVYQLDGGVVRYGEQFGDAGLWEGSLYVFDERRHVEFSSSARSLGRCTGCGGAAARYENCADPSCRTLRLFCASCGPLALAERCPVCVVERPEGPIASPGDARHGAPALTSVVPAGYPG